MLLGDGEFGEEVVCWGSGRGQLGKFGAQGQGLRRFKGGEEVEKDLGKRASGVGFK